MRKTHEQYIEEVRNLGLNIKVIGKYINSRIKIAHKCPKCGREDWMAQPGSILSGSSKQCKNCANNSWTPENYRNRAKALGIKVNGDYIGTTVSIAHTCPECGRDDWMIPPNRVLTESAKNAKIVLEIIGQI